MKSFSCFRCNRVGQVTRWLSTPLLLAVVSLASAQAELRVPAFTAYLDPDPEGASVSPHSGVTGWKDPSLKVLWFGDFKQAGKLDCSVGMRLHAGTHSKLRLTVAGQSHEAVVDANDEVHTVGFGVFEIVTPGYYVFTLESLNAPAQPAGDLQELLLAGPAATNAHFNLKPRRNAASVHLMYPMPDGVKVDAFYCEVTAVEDPLWTYYMACGWHRGYFGMQVNSPAERRIIFSVWDSGKEPDDRSKVPDADRVTLVSKGVGVFAGDFGNEGTGGHSHLVYPWKTGEKQRFLVTAKPVDSTHTVYAGYYFRPDKQAWTLITSWKAPKDGGYLRGLHSFSEDFGGANGNKRRKALYGNQWIRTVDGQWRELTTASFSFDPTGRADRLDRFMGVEDGQFFLSHGGFIAGCTPFGTQFTRPATDSLPGAVRTSPPSTEPILEKVPSNLTE